MDKYGGSFGTDDAFGGADPFGFAHAEEPEDDLSDLGPLPPPSPVGQDERRMQVRAYNHWASQLGTGNFPAITDLKPETLGDFGPYGILLYFGGRRGIDDPMIRFLGEKLAEECNEESGGDAQFKRLSDVPGRSLLSRITDHYLQILANQAPIGFEAEFTNQHGANVLYRGILMPWSSDGATIDYVFGVINWKEMADAATAEALLAAIDAGFEAPVPPYQEKDMDRMLDLSGFAQDTGGNEPTGLPTPSFGAASDVEDDFGADVRSPFDLADEADDDEEGYDEEGYDEDGNDEDGGEATEWGAGFSGFADEATVYTVDYGAQGLETGEEDEDFDGVVDPLADDTASLGLSSLVSRSGRVKQSVLLPGMAAAPIPAPVGAANAPAPFAAASAPSPSPSQAAADLTPRTTLEQRLRAAIPQAYDAGDPPAPLPRAAVFAPASEARQPDGEPLDLDAAFERPAPAAQPLLDLAEEAEPAASPFEPAGEEPDGLYDCLAAARELAHTASSSEDRGRKALYQAVARAYDFSLEAAANPGDFSELLAENGLAVQDRAPMTPIVKLVFGADYDKTRLTEYATVLGYAHRTGLARGTLDTLLASTEGGLKGIVQAERQARKEAEGKPLAVREGVRASLARKLRKLKPVDLGDLPHEGAEFALVMLRRLPSGELVVLGEVPEDIALVEKAARKLVS